MAEWEKLIPRPRTKFINVKCSDCGNEQVVFNCASTPIHCKVCGGLLAEPTGGKARIRGELISEVE